MNKGEVLLRINKKELTAKVVDGKFEFKGNLKNPSFASLYIKGNIDTHFGFYIENSAMIFKGNASNLRASTVSGCKVQNDYKKDQKGTSRIMSKSSKYLKMLYKPGISKKDKERIKSKLDEVKREIDNDIKELQKKFVKENPDAYYSGILVSRILRGVSGDEMLKYINTLNPKLKKHPIVADIAKRASKMSEVEVSIDELMKDVEDVTYKVDNNFKGTSHKKIKYLSTINDKNICALQGKNNICIISPGGREIFKFSPKLNGITTSLATDKENNIFVFSTIQKVISKKFRGKNIKKRVSIGVKCTVFNEKGERKNSFMIKEVLAASGAKIVGDKIIISDYNSKKVAFFNKETGKLLSEINNMRSCCGILDFSVKNNNEILVANLGAFRVQSYDFNGKSLLKFGQKGRTLNDFHGCCNPVSVAYLNNGTIVTVEKDPTRIKVYSKSGANKIIGIQELVKGCKYIPMISDSENNFYLASYKKGLVKCIKNTL